MFPGNINPKQLQGMMRQMGIKTEDIPAKRVVFELEGKNIVIEDPSVSCMVVQGKKTYTVMGEEKEEKKEEEPSKDDIEMVKQQAGCSEKEAEGALKETGGDIAEAIVKLKKEE